MRGINFEDEGGHKNLSQSRLSATENLGDDWIYTMNWDINLTLNFANILNKRHLVVRTTKFC